MSEMSWGKGEAIQKQVLGPSESLGAVTAVCRVRADRVGVPSTFINDWVLKSQGVQGHL